MKLHLITLSWASCVRTRCVGLAGLNRFLAPGQGANPFDRLEVLLRDRLYLFIGDERDLSELQMVQGAYTDATGAHELVLHKIWGGRLNVHQRTVVLQGQPQPPFTMTVDFALEGKLLHFRADYSGATTTCFAPWQSS